ncbi:MAG: fibronectin type III domain-containing protein [Acidovorax sp.]|nr:MAG: fibronectin type III domain-containing protein [Acidovorax sp.]
MKWILGAALGLLVAGVAQAANYAVQDGGAGSGCPNAWPPSIVGNYNENGTLNGAPRYDGNGWYLYRTDIFGATSWVVSNTLASNDVNNGTVAFYAASSGATPPTGTGYDNTNSACGKINVQAGVVVPPPSAPTMAPLNAGVQPYISGGSTNVAWMGVAGVVGYKLDVSTDAGFGSFWPGYNGLVVTGSPTPPTSITVTGLNNAGTTYYFRVRSYNGGGDSANSATVSTTTVPATPAIQAASDVRALRFTANWSASAGTSGHRLQVCTDAGFASCLAGYNPASLSDNPSALVTGLSQNTTYHYRVAAGNENGYSAYSSGASVVTNALPAFSGTFMTNGAVNDNATIAPFSGVSVGDANGDPVSVGITYTAANGTLSGAGLTGSAGSYTLTSAAPATLTSRLQALVFNPTYGQGPAGTTVTTTFTLLPNDGIDNGAGNSATAVTTTMTNVAPVFIGATTNTSVNGNSSANDVKGLLHVRTPTGARP